MSTSQIVFCKILTNRFVIKQHNLLEGPAAVLELQLRNNVTWIDSVWITNDYLYKCLTVLFEPNATFKAAPEPTRCTMYEELVGKTLEFMKLDPSSTDIRFEDY